jgi:hypothetical protein
MLKVDRKTEMSRIGPTVDFFRADVQNFHYDDLTSDYELKPITGKTSPSFRLRYVVESEGR